MPAVSSGADIDTDELVDETGVEPKDIELIMSQVSIRQTGHDPSRRHTRKKPQPEDQGRTAQRCPTSPYCFVSCGLNTNDRQLHVCTARLNTRHETLLFFEVAFYL